MFTSFLSFGEFLHYMFCSHGFYNASLFQAERYTDEQANNFKCEMNLQAILMAIFSLCNLISQTATQFFQRMFWLNTWGTMELSWKHVHA